ncbi:MAG: transposase, partial [Nitrosomonas sp.]|nr:transposase [Nitrosomonas sp.]
MSRQSSFVALDYNHKKREQAHDPEMHQTKKGKHGYFGMKVHAGADVDFGAVHTVEIAAANEADINILPKQLGGG